MLTPRHTISAVRRRWPGYPQRLHARGRNVVVLYHRIAREPQPDAAGMVVDPERLRRQLVTLREHFDVVPAADVLRPSRRPQAAITFDDGYRDNLELAVPLLRELSLPATLFVVTGALDQEREYWWDRLEHVLLECPPGEVELRLGRHSTRLVVRVDADRRRGIADLGRRLLQCPPLLVEQALEQLEAWSGVVPRPCRRHRRLGRQEVAEVGADPLFEIGSHTCSHSALRRLPRADCDRELRTSRAVLGTLLGAPPRLLAYPYGAPGTVGRADARRARAAGYSTAFANVTGPTEGASPYAVPRVAVGEWEPEQLLQALTRWSRS